MYLKPCRACPKTRTCIVTKPLNSKLHRMGITSAFVKCETWRSLFPIGARVATELRFDDRDDPTEPPYWDEVEAIVVGLHRDKVALWSLSETRHQLIRVYADRLTLVDAPLVDVCPDCRKPREAKSKGWLCDTCGISLEMILT